jgi:tetratricopeptide (TPR) repeat protein
MTVSVGPPTTSTPGVAGQPSGTPPPQGVQSRANRFRGPLILLIVALLFAGTYLLAWFNANRLATRFIADADASYAAGDYLKALSGGEYYDADEAQYVTEGGYIQVERIFAHAYAWPKGGQQSLARERIQEIITQRLTIADAERFIVSNTGRRDVPYFGEIYLRLGELYEAEGDAGDARDIYEEMPRLFPNRPDLIEQARAHLARLGPEE